MTSVIISKRNTRVCAMFYAWDVFQAGAAVLSHNFFLAFKTETK